MSGFVDKGVFFRSISLFPSFSKGTIIATFSILSFKIKNYTILNTSTTTAPAKFSAETEERLELILDSIRDIKGKKIVRLDLRKLHDRPADFFFVCEGDSTTQVSSIANNVQKRLKQEMGDLPKTATGGRHANWICLDYFDVVVHIFYPETRAFYQLEDLWSDADITAYDA